MKISVVIPSFNRAHSIEQAIDSVLQQSTPPHEIIVVDDHSTDATRRALIKFKKQIKVIRNEANEGVSISRNKGIEASSGDWIAFLDSDDCWDSKKLELQTRFHAADPNLRISQCDEIWIRNGNRVNPMTKHAKKGGWIFQECIPRCVVSPSAVIIHRDIFAEIGVFDPHLPACEDYDLWLRIAPYYEIGYLDQKLVTRYGGHEDQLSRKYWGMDRFRITAMEKHLDLELRPEWKTTLLEELIFKCGIVATGAKKRENEETAVSYLKKQELYQDMLLSQIN